MKQKVDTQTVVKLLSIWFKRHARPLPWRVAYDPYQVWLSEIMLQQTQVTTVLPYFERFLAAFPTVHDLAKAPEEKVLTLWAGLGYYSRARNIHKAAKQIVDLHEGKFPKDRDAILAIPGIGPYTAGAILSIAYDLAEPIVDGNVERVLSRVYVLTDPLGSATLKPKVWKFAEDWVKEAKSPRILNQAMMELGALVCIKGNPRCHLCPISEHCEAKQKELQNKIPKPKVRPAKKRLYWLPIILKVKDEYFIHQNQEGDWWHGLWDFPHVAFEEQAALETTREELLKKLPKGHHWKEHPSVKHTVTHHDITVYPHSITFKKKPNLKGFPGQWTAAKEISDRPFSALAKKIFTSLEW